MDATDIIIIICIILFILCINKFSNLVPYMIGSMVRWKESANIEYSMKISRDRDIICCLCVVPFCLCAARYGLFPPILEAGLPPLHSFLLTTGVGVAYIALRFTANFVGRMFTNAKTDYEIATKASRTFFCTATALTLATAGILSLAGLDFQTIRTVLFYVIGVIYIVFLLRKCQILSKSCSLFTTILYLCSLEILPTAILIAAALVL